MTTNLNDLQESISSVFASGHSEASEAWAETGSYPCRPGNELQILIDGQAAYHEIAAAFYVAKKFSYPTISFGDEDFLFVPESGETLFDVLRSRRKQDVDIRMVVWQPGRATGDTIPDRAPGTIAGVNAGPGGIQARWDAAKAK